MNPVAIAMAKLGPIPQAINGLLEERWGHGPNKVHYERFRKEAAQRYFVAAAAQLAVLQKELPQLFDDFPPLYEEPEVGMTAPHENEYSRGQMQRLARSIEQIVQMRAHFGEQPVAPPSGSTGPQNRVFLSHGRSKDWYVVQAHIEKDLRHLGLQTLELAQEPSLGSTIIEKLEANTKKCDSAAIVMSGDDKDGDDNLRARENVMHEIGYFQASYGRSKVILLHEDGVTVPTNLAGIVYVPYPRDRVDATFGVLARELKAMYGR